MILADDRDLAVRSRRGDGEAFGELVRRHQTAVFNVAYRMLGHRQDAEDAAQEAFIRAYRAFATFDLARPLVPWLKKIAANVCFNRLEIARPEADPLDDEMTDLTPARAADPEVVAQANELSERVHSEILRLSPRYRAAIELRHFQGLSYDEMAEALQRPLSDVKSDLFRARRQLAEWLKDLDIDT